MVLEAADSCDLSEELAAEMSAAVRYHKRRVGEERQPSLVKDFGSGGSCFIFGRDHYACARELVYDYEYGDVNPMPVFGHVEEVQRNHLHWLRGH